MMTGPAYPGWQATLPSTNPPASRTADMRCPSFPASKPKLDLIVLDSMADGPRGWLDAGIELKSERGRSFQTFTCSTTFGGIRNT